MLAWFQRHIGGVYWRGLWAIRNGKHPENPDVARITASIATAIMFAWGGIYILTG